MHTWSTMNRLICSCDVHVLLMLSYAAGKNELEKNGDFGFFFFCGGIFRDVSYSIFHFLGPGRSGVFLIFFFTLLWSVRACGGVFFSKHFRGNDGSTAASHVFAPQDC
jgi:hypothetical protein